MEFEEKVDIEDLVLPSKPIVLLDMETIDIKEEPLEKGSDTVSIHESKTNILNMETIDIKEEPLEKSRSMISIHESSQGLLNSSSPCSNKFLKSS